jgi:hypothetical protein
LERWDECILEGHAASNAADGRRKLNHSARRRREQGRDYSRRSSIDAEASVLNVFKSLGGSIGIRTTIETKFLDLEGRRSEREAEVQSKRLEVDEENVRPYNIFGNRLTCDTDRLLLLDLCRYHAQYCSRETTSYHVGALPKVQIDSV